MRRADLLDDTTLSWGSSLACCPYHLNLLIYIPAVVVKSASIPSLTPGNPTLVLLRWSVAPNHPLWKTCRASVAPVSRRVGCFSTVQSSSPPSPEPSSLIIPRATRARQVFHSALVSPARHATRA